MKMNVSLKALLLGGAAAASSGYAYGQGIMPLPQPQGTEQITVYPNSLTNPNDGGSQATMPLYEVHNGAGYIVGTSASSISATVTLTSATRYLVQTVQPNTATITLPATPFDGELVDICNASTTAWATNVINVVAAASTTLTSFTLTALAASTCAELLFQNSNTTWYRLK